MNRNDTKNKILSLGFVETDQQPVLNYVIPYVDYYYRMHQKQHQYVWLVSYDDKVVEIVFEVYKVARNSRAKHHPDITEQENRGLKPLSTDIARDFEKLYSVYDKVYPDFAARKKQENKL
jgi:hypothetical protein